MSNFNLIVMWQWSTDFPNQAALKTVLPCNYNVTLTKISVDMMLIVMYCLTQTSFKITSGFWKPAAAWKVGKTIQMYVKCKMLHKRTRK